MRTFGTASMVKSACTPRGVNYRRARETLYATIDTIECSELILHPKGLGCYYVV